MANADDAASNLEAVIKAGAKRSEAALAVIGVMITNQVKIIITQTFPPQSAPGTPPHLRTGGLRQSYKFEVQPAQEGRVANVKVYSDQSVLQPVPPNKRAIYASYLEFGTSKMRARPHLRPAVDSVRPLISGVLRLAWAEGTYGAAKRGKR